MEKKSEKKPQVLSLHGHGANAEILKKEMELGWPQAVLEKLDLVFLNGPFLLQDKVDSHGIFNPPYSEWFQNDKIIRKAYGPFDGVLGFSQGGVLTASMPRMQRGKVTLTKVPNIKFVTIISGAKFVGRELGLPKLASNAFSSPI
uniref:Uncharacterized protein LOC104247763 n=1 Tax=Nicotiana sylvestris TaxID=4096 RepID=A0A1U7YSF7_NICSY|nr:PREDICTED: uncharacterized protein LOC104247763 [Nicotiana sylvestris]